MGSIVSKIVIVVIVVAVVWVLYQQWRRRADAGRGPKRVARPEDTSTALEESQKVNRGSMWDFFRTEMLGAFGNEIANASVLLPPPPPIPPALAISPPWAGRSETSFRPVDLDTVIAPTVPNHATPVANNANGRARSQTEELCANIITEMFPNSEVLTNVRPNWLRNPRTGRNLELDIFLPNESLALEYQGQQHYIYPNRFHHSEEEFRQQIFRDVWKRQRCVEEGIDLIIVPYTARQNLRQSIEAAWAEIQSRRVERSPQSEVPILHPVAQNLAHDTSNEVDDDANSDLT